MKMKNFKNIAIISLFVLCGCDNLNTTTLTLDINKVINGFKDGIKLKIEAIESYNGNINMLYMQNAVKEKEFSFIQYKDEYRNEISLHEYYTNQNDNYIYSTRLDVSNTYNYYALYNPATSEKYSWDDGYYNPFSKLSVNSFTKINDTCYELSSEEIELMSNSITTLLYGNPGLELISLNLYLDTNGYHISSEAKFEGKSIYHYVFDANVIEFGKEVKMDYRSKPFSEVKDTIFEEMISLLKTNNYTAEIYNNDGFDETTSFVYSNADKFYYETGNYKVGFYEVDENTMQEVTKDGDDFYKVGFSFDKNRLPIKKPSFNLNRACFDLNEDCSYSLKKGVEGSMDVVSFLENAADELDNFKISKTTDGYVFKNTYSSGNETTVKFTNIGKTDVGFNKDTVLEPIAGAKWKDILDEKSYAYLVSASSEEEAENIPVPEGYSSWMQWSEEEGISILVAEPSATLEDDFNAYSLQLIRYGFEISEEPGENGGVCGIKSINVNGVNKTLFVEFLEYYGYFCIATYSY